MSDEVPFSESNNSGEDPSGFDDIELAYREALKSIEQAEYQVGFALQDIAESTDGEADEEAAFVSVGEELAEELSAPTADESDISVRDEGSHRVSSTAVIEAALFVGGEVALTARRLASLIGKDTDTRLVVRLIDRLNELYAEQNRPYIIRLREGGFRMELREEFGDIRMKVFGLGPREVRLSPEALEILAFIAYNQPVSRQALSEVRKSNTSTVVRQLLRLNLVELDRPEAKKSDVTYRTGNRFLRLFDLDTLEDLPNADIFRFK